jgi:hypothetical protein
VTVEARVAKGFHENTYGTIIFSQSYGMFRLECAKQEIPQDNATEGRREMTGSIPLIFLLGTLIGVLAGGAMCVRYLRQELAADIGPRLRRLQLQLDSLESALNLVLVSRYAEIGSQLSREGANRSIGGGPT